MSVKTSEQVLADLAIYIEQQIKVVNVNPNTVLFDSFIDRLQSRISELYTDITGLQQDQSIAFASSITTAALDRLGYDWNLTRKSDVSATGTVVFISFTQPAADIRIGSTDGTGGVTVQTRRRADGTVVTYTTTSTVYLLKTATKDPVTNTYRISAPIQSANAGLTGNADSNEINSLKTSIPGIDAVTNTVALTNGQTQETNTQFAKRIAAKVLGLHSGTENGLISLGLSLDRVTDAAVSGPNDSDFVRNPTGGEVDLIILGENIEEIQDIVIKLPGVNTYGFTKLPVLAVDSVQATVGLSTVILSPVTDYQFVQDTTSAYAYSIQSGDLLQFLYGGTKPNDNTPFTVTYRHDKLVFDAQTLITGDDTQFITASPLAKRAKESLVDITITVTKVSGSDTSTVQQQVQTAISDFVNGLGLGDPLQQSDIVVVVHKVTDVDNIILPLGKLCRTGGTGTQDLVASKYEFFRLNPLGFTVNVS